MCIHVTSNHICNFFNCLLEELGSANEGGPYTTANMLVGKKSLRASRLGATFGVLLARQRNGSCVELKRTKHISGGLVTAGNSRGLGMQFGSGLLVKSA